MSSSCETTLAIMKRKASHGRERETSHLLRGALSLELMPRSKVSWVLLPHRSAELCTTRRTLLPTLDRLRPLGPRQQPLQIGRGNPQRKRMATQRKLKGGPRIQVQLTTHTKTKSPLPFDPCYPQKRIRENQRPWIWKMEGFLYRSAKLTWI